MTRSIKSSLFTADFRREFEAETATLLRKRFLWFAGLVIAISATILLIDMVLAIVAGTAEAPQPAETGADERESSDDLISSLLSVLLLLVKFVFYIACFMWVWRHKIKRELLLSLTLWVVLVDGTVAVLRSALDTSAVPAFFQISLTHLLACIFLPWSPREAIRAIAGPTLLFILWVLFLWKVDIWVRILVVFTTPSMGLPGTLVCWIRHSRRLDDFKLRFLHNRYDEVRKDLVDARRIHEALFPDPGQVGPLRFRYQYEPMRQIGGDYLHAFNSKAKPDQPFSVVLIDVTGHGVPAALTVNRLHGELERVFAETPDADPGKVLALLNRYVHLTLSSHSVFVTAICMRVDPTIDTLEYASGGHPPAFVKTADGRVEQLPSTTFILGVCPADEFDPEMQAVTFAPGDSVIAYTDGAIEARDRHGRMLGIEGLQWIIASEKPDPQHGWPETVLQLVRGYREGGACDDTLVVEIHHMLESARAASAPPPSDIPIESPAVEEDEEEIST